MAPKPRGLKASKGAAAFIPAAPAPPASSDASPDPSTRTFPLDEDALTISDLFELKSSALALLLSSSSTPEQQDEASSLLRGILHGADSLLSLLSSPISESFFSPTPRPASQALELATPRYQALGLAHPAAPAHLAYLQAFALHELAGILPPAEEKLSAIASSSAAGGGGGKRRKVDLKEPTKPVEWLEEALGRYAVAGDWVASEGEAGGQVLQVLLGADAARAKCDRAVLAFLEHGESAEEAGRKALSGVGEALDAVVAQLSGAPQVAKVEEDSDDDAIDMGDPHGACLRAAGAYLAVLDGFPACGDSLHRLAEIRRFAGWITRTRGGRKAALEGETDEDRGRREVEIEVLRADVAMAEFVLVEEAVEDKYRPEEGEDDDEDDDEGEVVPLPDEDDVRAAKAQGEKAIALLRSTIALLTASPASKQLASLKTAQYEKLEEAYLTYSALINPDDEEKTAKVEAELATIRKEGGLEDPTANEE